MIGAIAAVLALAALWATTVYNRIQDLSDTVDDAWQRLATQLKRRHDLTEELVSEVSDAADLDPELIESVTGVNQSAQAVMRRAATDRGVRAAARAEATLSEVLSRLKVALTRYPDWHPRQRIQVLLQEITATEVTAREALHAYNQSVHTLTEHTVAFGWQLVARMAGVPAAEVWADVTRTSSGPAPSIREHEATRD